FALHPVIELALLALLRRSGTLSVLRGFQETMFDFRQIGPALGRSQDRLPLRPAMLAVAELALHRPPKIAQQIEFVLPGLDAGREMPASLRASEAHCQHRFFRRSQP